MFGRAPPAGRSPRSSAPHCPSRCGHPSPSTGSAAAPRRATGRPPALASPLSHGGGAADPRGAHRSPRAPLSRRWRMCLRRHAAPVGPAVVASRRPGGGGGDARPEPERATAPCSHRSTAGKISGASVAGQPLLGAAHAIGTSCTRRSPRPRLRRVRAEIIALPVGDGPHGAVNDLPGSEHVHGRPAGRGGWSKSAQRRHGAHPARLARPSVATICVPTRTGPRSGQRQTPRRRPVMATVRATSRPGVTHPVLSRACFHAARAPPPTGGAAPTVSADVRTRTSGRTTAAVRVPGGVMTPTTPAGGRR
jgi:hypothetical protein